MLPSRTTIRLMHLLCSCASFLPRHMLQLAPQPQLPPLTKGGVLALSPASPARTLAKQPDIQRSDKQLHAARQAPFLRNAPPPAGLPEAGKPSAKPKSFGSWKNDERSSSPKVGKNGCTFWKAQQ